MSDSKPTVAVSAAARVGKWIKGLSPDMPVAAAAARVLDARLNAVWHWLPMAATRSSENAEYVHQLRVATRRAVAAIRIFSPVLDGAAADKMRATLRRIREAASEARNWDVLLQRFQRTAPADSPSTARVIDQIRRRREQAQAPLQATCEAVSAADFPGQVASLLAAVQPRSSQRSFGSYARRCSRTAAKKFFRAAVADLDQEENLHSLRIRAKKLRYVMEVAATAFEPQFIRRLYPRVELLQEVLGTINDHATARRLFDDWRKEAEDRHQQAYLEGLVAAEGAALADLRRAMGVVWTRPGLRKLKRQFRAYAGKP